MILVAPSGSSKFWLSLLIFGDDIFEFEAIFRIVWIEKEAKLGLENIRRIAIIRAI